MLSIVHGIRFSFRPVGIKQFVSTGKFGKKINTAIDDAGILRIFKMVEKKRFPEKSKNCFKIIGHREMIKGKALFFEKDQIIQFSGSNFC